ncbi:hypothetical protein CHS0354_010194 [Potamilus streckersoni]|uniref:Uncharacterized protein n=1 Tax=Potamilus streckersoni TaxID=2493646 RepID=A0AAE0RSN5_9BIVA|nr:hypothetical protein CHS0354_010194 [Potamilus streckersoni]
MHLGNGVHGKVNILYYDEPLPPYPRETLGFLLLSKFVSPYWSLFQNLASVEQIITQTTNKNEKKTTCTPLHVTFFDPSVEEGSGILNGLEIVDVTPGIHDPSIFTPPKSCTGVPQVTRLRIKGYKVTDKIRMVKVIADNLV